jgi:hypothetical protein
MDNPAVALQSAVVVIASFVGAIGLPGTVAAFAGWILDARPPTDAPPP